MESVLASEPDRIRARSGVSFCSRFFPAGSFFRHCGEVWELVLSGPLPPSSPSTPSYKPSVFRLRTPKECLPFASCLAVGPGSTPTNSSLPLGEASLSLSACEGAEHGGRLAQGHLACICEQPEREAGSLFDAGPGLLSPLHLLP